MKKLIIVLLLLMSFIALSQNKTDEKSKINEDKAVKSEKKEAKTSPKDKKNEVKKEDFTESDFELNLNKLENEVNILKEKIFRSKARLATLQETLISGKSIESAKMVIKHINKMTHFDLKSIIYYLDGEPLEPMVDIDGSLSNLKSKILFDDIAVPGIHMISIVAKLEISEMGLFDYAKGYRFQLKADRSFQIQEGKTVTISIELTEKGGYFNDITKKPTVIFKADIKDGLNISKGKKK